MRIFRIINNTIPNDVMYGVFSYDVGILVDAPLANFKN